MNRRLPSPLLMLVTRPHSRLAGIAAEAVQGGVNLVQVRDREGRSDVLATTRQLRALFTRDRACIVVNAPGFDLDPGLEGLSAAGADGVHLSEVAPAPASRKLLLGRSVHSLGRALEAEAEGVDYLVFGTVFESASHPGQEPSGLAALHGVCRSVPLPVIAIGGVTPGNAASCLSEGAAGVAVLSSIMDAEVPLDVAQRYRRALGIEEADVEVKVPARPPEAIINGKSVALELPVTIREFLKTRGLHEQIVVVEHNHEIVPRDRYGDVSLGADDIVEIVQMTAGG